METKKNFRETFLLLKAKVQKAIDSFATAQNDGLKLAFLKNECIGLEVNIDRELFQISTAQDFSTFFAAVDENKYAVSVTLLTNEKNRVAALYDKVCAAHFSA
jgi:hypothetical protein